MIQCDLCKKYFDSVKDVQDAGTVKVSVLTEIDSEVFVSTGIKHLCFTCLARYNNAFDLSKTRAIEAAKVTFLDIMRAGIDALRKEK